MRRTNYDVAVVCYSALDTLVPQRWIVEALSESFIDAVSVSREELDKLAGFIRAYMVKAVERYTEATEK